MRMTTKLNMTSTDVYTLLHTIIIEEICNGCNGYINSVTYGEYFIDCITVENYFYIHTRSYCVLKYLLIIKPEFGRDICPCMISFTYTVHIQHRTETSY